MTEPTPISKAKPKKRVGYTLTVCHADEPGFCTYEIHNPDGSLYGEGQRRGRVKEVGEHYQKTVKRLNAAAGFASARWSKKTANPEHPNAVLHWTHPFKRARA